MRPVLPHRRPTWSRWSRPPPTPADEAAIAEQLATTNASFGRDEQISKVVVADARFSVDNGMLTSQFKPKRKQIFETYRAQINDRRRAFMQTDIETAARRRPFRVLDVAADAPDIDLGLDMTDGYGLTSLNKVLFLMAVCDDTDVPLTAFAEPDVARMRTLGDVVTALSDAKAGAR